MIRCPWLMAWDGSAAISGVNTCCAWLPEEDAKLLDSRLGTPLGPEVVTRLRRLIEDSGAREQVEQVIGELTGRALAALDAADVTTEARGVLRGLAASATQRNV